MNTKFIIKIFIFLIIFNFYQFAYAQETTFLVITNLSAMKISYDDLSKILINTQNYLNKINPIDSTQVFKSYVKIGYPLNTDYAGSEKCLICHNDLNPENCNEWLNSAHHLGTKYASDYNDIPGDFNKNPFFKKKDVKIIIGYKSGRYVFIGNDLQVFPIEWSQTDTVWKKRSVHDAAVNCFGCHTTGYFVSFKKFAELGVGCEACHGPGKKHIDSKGENSSIINPAKLSPDRNRMVCGQCHSTGRDISGTYRFPVICAGINSETGENILGPFQPGEDLTSVFVDAKQKSVRTGYAYSSLIQAPEYYSKLICTDCHGPHGKSENHSMLIDEPNELCLKCHINSIDDLSVHRDADKTTCLNCHKLNHTH